MQRRSYAREVREKRLASLHLRERNVKLETPKSDVWLSPVLLRVIGAFINRIGCGGYYTPIIIWNPWDNIGNY